MLSGKREGRAKREVDGGLGGGEFFKPSAGSEIGPKSWSSGNSDVDTR